MLGETYYSQVPLRYGDYMAKLSIAPVSPGLRALTDAKVDLDDRPDGLRAAVVAFFAGEGGEWELRAQLCTTSTHADRGRVGRWPEDESPYVTVAPSRRRAAAGVDRRTLPAVVDDRLAFSPWHGIAAHRPLGSVNRARKPAYEMSKRFRAEHNGVAIDEPAKDVTLP